MTSRDPDQLLAAHLADALRAHREQVERDGFAVPPSYHAFEQMYAIAARAVAQDATARHSTTTFDMACEPDNGVPVQPLALRYDQAAAQLGISVRSLQRRIADGDLIPVQIGGANRIRTADLDAYVAGLRPTAAAS